jgi:outer membrane protein assembly factor BamA
LRLEAGYRADDYESLENETSWSMSGGDFLPNPPVQEGTMRSVFGGVHLGSDDLYLRVNYETAGDDIAGGDFDFDQLTAEGRTQIYLGPSQRIDMRVKFGTALSGVLPNQRRYFAGGLGTVRGYEYQSLLASEPDTTGYRGGQQVLLANVEYKFGLGSGWARGWGDDWDWDWDWDWHRGFGFDLALFFDTGMAWSDRDAAIKLDDLKSSAGVGVLFGGDDGFRLNVIWPFEDNENDVVFQARLQRMF